MRRSPYLSLIAVVLGLIGLQNNAQAQENELVIAVQPTATAEELSARGEELEKFLEAETGQAVTLRFPTSYASVIEALRFGHAHAALMGAWPAWVAHQQANAEVVLAEVREVTIGQDKTEAPHYFSYWVVRTDSPYQRLEELKGKRAAFPSQLSTSGFVAPMAKLVELGWLTRGEEGVDPKQYFGEVQFAGGYAQAWEALRAGQADVTVIAGDVPEKLYKEVLANTRVLEQQGPIPSHAVVAGQNLTEPSRKVLIDAFMKLNDPEHRGLMRKFISGIFVRFQSTTTQDHLGSLGQFLETTGLAFTEKPATSR